MARDKNIKDKKTVKGGNKTDKPKKAPKSTVRRTRQDVWIAKPKKAPMIGAPGILMNHSIPAWERFCRALKHPGSITAPAFDDNHMLQLGAGVAEGTYVHNPSNTTTDYMVLLIRTAASALYSTSPSTQLGVYNWVSMTTDATSVIKGSDIGGTGGPSWSALYGDTAPASRVIPWATTVQAIINAPPSVIQGSVWVGNMPMQQIIGRKIGELVRNARYSYAADHLPYMAKNTITELGLFHSEPVDRSAETDAKKFDPVERITYMIFSPSLIGSIGGTVPSSYQVTVTARTNYAWVPVYQPIVSKTVESEVNLDVNCGVSAKDKAKLADTVQMEAASAVPEGAEVHSMNEDRFRAPDSGHGPRERKMLRLGDAGPASQGSAENAEDLRRRLTALNQKMVNPEEGGWRYGPAMGPFNRGQNGGLAKYHNHPYFLPAPDDRHYHDPLDQLKAYDGYVADCEYLSRILQARWKSLREDPEACASFLMLRDAVRKASEALAELHERNKSERALYTEVEYVETDEDVYVNRYTSEGKAHRLNSLPIYPKESEKSFRDSSTQSKRK